MEQLKVLCISQARMGSTRLPGKVLMKAGGQSLLSIHLQRILKSKLISKLILATTVESGDDATEQEALRIGVECFRGNTNDVLDRYYKAASAFKPEWVVRVTADCPLIDGTLIDKVIRFATENNVDYVSNTLEQTFPNGEDIEVFKFSALQKAWNEATSTSDREHVTQYIYRNSDFKGGILFKAQNYSEGLDYGHVRITVDRACDYEIIKALVDHLGNDKGWREYADFYIDSSLLQFLKQKQQEQLNQN